jgi:hypothetical protein
VIDVASDKVIVERIRPILETCANSILSLCMQPCAGGGVFPLAFLVNSWRRRPDLPEADLKAMFRTYLETESVPGTGETFMAGIGRLVENARTELARLIDPASAAHLLRLDADVLLGLSGTDALGDRLRELMAGLPPPKQEAKTNLGLPKPEEHGGKFAGLIVPNPSATPRSIRSGTSIFAVRRPCRNRPAICIGTIWRRCGIPPRRNRFGRRSSTAAFASARS